MASLRDFFIRAIRASTALTSIPASPIRGTSYRNTNMTNAERTAGARYNSIAPSEFINQQDFEESSVLNEVDKFGIPGWTDLIDYQTAAIVRGSDGNHYKANAASGPAGTVRDPVIDPSTWDLFGGLVGNSSAGVLNIGTWQIRIGQDTFPAVADAGSFSIRTDITYPAALTTTPRAFFGGSRIGSLGAGVQAENSLSVSLDETSTFGQAGCRVVLNSNSPNVNHTGDVFYYIVVGWP